MEWKIICLLRYKIRMKRLVTYSMSRPFSSMNIPIPVQSGYLRDYAQRRNMIFSLPVTEVCFSNSFYSLSNTLRSLTRESDFGAVSIMVLPLSCESTFSTLMECIKYNETRFHFPLEDFVGSKNDIKSWRDEYLFMKSFTANKPSTMFVSSYIKD